MTRLLVGFPPARFLVVFGMVLLAASCNGKKGESADENGGDTDPQPSVSEVAQIYFPGSGGLLRAEPREVSPELSPVARAEEIVGLLLAGPEDDSLIAPFPTGTQLGAVDLDVDEVAYVSLEGPEGEGSIATGSRHELLMLYSVVNSVALNVDGVSRVVVLWNGLQRQTLAGHIDTSRPLEPDERWVEGG